MQSGIVDVVIRWRAKLMIQIDEAQTTVLSGGKKQEYDGKCVGLETRQVGGEK